MRNQLRQRKPSNMFLRFNFGQHRAAGIQRNVRAYRRRTVTLSPCPCTVIAYCRVIPAKCTTLTTCGFDLVRFCRMRTAHTARSTTVNTTPMLASRDRGQTPGRQSAASRRLGKRNISLTSGADDGASCGTLR